MLTAVSRSLSADAAKEQLSGRDGQAFPIFGISTTERIRTTAKLSCSFSPHLAANASGQRSRQASRVTSPTPSCWAVRRAPLIPAIAQTSSKSEVSPVTPTAPIGCPTPLMTITPPAAGITPFGAITPNAATKLGRSTASSSSLREDWPRASAPAALPIAI
jgi:hypothetical protein